MAEEKIFQKQVAKEGFQSANAKFMGLADEPKTGKKDDKEWRKVKVKFHIDGKSQENKFIIWTPLTSDKSKYKSEEEIKQFSQYNIVWVESEEDYDGREWVEKKIICINEVKEETTTPTQSTSELDISNFDDFKTAYMNVIKEKGNKFDAVHMLGSYIGTYETERVAELMCKCKVADK